MNVFGILLTAAGLVLFSTALAMTIRANGGRRIPFWRNAEVVPRGSVAMRSIGAGFLVFGAVLLSADAGWWALLVVLIAFGVVLLRISLHNSRTARETRV